MVADIQPIGSAMWGGRRPDGTYPQGDDTDQATPNPRVQVAIRDLLSMVLLVVGSICGILGGAILAGWGGALIAVGVILVPVALLLGAGD